MSPVWQDFLNTQGAGFEAGRLLNFTGNEINETRAIDNIVTDLSHLALIEVSGREAEDFLHGQFTINIKQLSNNHSQFSAWCNPKGQVKATFLIYRHDNDFIILLPAELKEPFVKQLQMYVLRADVKISDKSDDLVRIGVQTKDDTSLFGLIDSVPEEIANISQGEVIVHNDLHYLRIVSNETGRNVHRYILIGAVDRQIILWKELMKHVTPVGTSLWELLDIQTAYPWVTSQTTEKFLPQMLNLDLIDGLNYQKGCYPGQEIIARLHFRGQLKRSLYLATCSLDSHPENGDQLYTNNIEQSVGTVINAQAFEDKYFLLAVIEKEQIANNISLRQPDGASLALQPLPYKDT